MPDGELIGRVSEIWRHPVQSMRGERLQAAAIDATGLRGDRAYGIVDPESGERVSSAQGKRKWRGIVRLEARFLAEPQPDREPPPVAIALPAGGSVRSDEAGLEERLTDALGRPVRFRRRSEAPCSYAYAPLHLLTTATLAALRGNYPAEFAPQRFRPNLVVDTDGPSGFVETGWIGRRLAIGDGVVLRVTAHCLRCIMTVLPQGELPQDPGILQTVTDANERRAGSYAEILTAGRVAHGDPVRLVG